MSTDFALSLVMVLFAHAAANSCNTYYDFITGVDKKDTADDRALVIPDPKSFL